MATNKRQYCVAFESNSDENASNFIEKRLKNVFPQLVAYQVTLPDSLQRVLKVVLSAVAHCCLTSIYRIHFKFLDVCCGRCCSILV